MALLYSSDGWSLQENQGNEASEETYNECFSLSFAYNFEQLAEPGTLRLAVEFYTNWRSAYEDNGEGVVGEFRVAWGHVNHVCEARRQNGDYTNKYDVHHILEDLRIELKEEARGRERGGTIIEREMAYNMEGYEAFMRDPLTPWYLRSEDEHELEEGERLHNLLVAEQEADLICDFIDAEEEWNKCGKSAADEEEGNRYWQEYEASMAYLTEDMADVE
jgi:hypothetical protein